MSLLSDLFGRKDKPKPDFSSSKAGFPKPDFSDPKPNFSNPKTDFSNIQSGSSTTAQPPSGVPSARTVIVAAGDSLSKIAKREYGDASKWRRIFEANRDLIKDPDLIQPGQKLSIPQ